MTSVTCQLFGLSARDVIGVKAMRVKLCMQTLLMKAMVEGHVSRPPRPMMPSADLCYFGCQKIMEGRLASETYFTIFNHCVTH